MYWMGGLGLVIAGLLEFVLGKYVFFSSVCPSSHTDTFLLPSTFPSVVFVTFGSFWLSFGFLLQPTQGIATALAEYVSLTFLLSSLQS